MDVLYSALVQKFIYIYMCIYREALFQMCVCVSHSVVSDSFVTPRTIAHQASLSIGFSRQEYWSGLPFPSPGDLSRLAASKPRGCSGWSCSSVSKGCVTASLFMLDHGQRAGKSGQARFRSRLCRLLALSAWLYHLDRPCLSLLLCKLNQREEDKGSTLPQNSQVPLLHPSHSVSHQVVPGGVSVATGTPEPSDLHFACKDLEELRAALRTRSCKNGQEV